MQLGLNLTPTWHPTNYFSGAFGGSMLASFGHLAPEPDFDRFLIDFRQIFDRFLIDSGSNKKLRKQRRTHEKHTDNEHEKHRQTKRQSKQQANPSLKVGVLVFPVGARRDSRSAGSIKAPRKKSNMNLSIKNPQGRDQRV